MISGSDISYSHELRKLKERILEGGNLTRREALFIAETPDLNLLDILATSNNIRERFRGNYIDLCAIVNAKSGACSEDCAYCAQSSKNKAEVPIYPLIEKDAILQKAEEAKRGGVTRFSIVTSGKRISKKELVSVSTILKDIRDIGLIPCASLGMLSKDELLFLKESGLDRYHHNIETSERFYPYICSTHTFSGRIKTIESALTVGLSVCSGGIFGMGESWQDRVDMAFILRDLNVESIPINFLIPIKGTPLYNRDMLHPFEALRIISLFRLTLPDKSIRVCGGRIQVLREFHSLIFMSGADSILTGNYLTTTGRTFEDDHKLIRLHELITTSSDTA